MSLGFTIFDGASVFAGARQPWSRHARKNGVKTLYGVPSDFVTLPGETR
ncbi:Uncharacterised protein [Mycobacteroides abscessus subsp. abscessus]|nr:Uncharacterised protein [Mycobacteroides abscessus subsp. abscessus]